MFSDSLRKKLTTKQTYPHQRERVAICHTQKQNTNRDDRSVARYFPFFLKKISLIFFLSTRSLASTTPRGRDSRGIPQWRHRICSTMCKGYQTIHKNCPSDHLNKPKTKKKLQTRTAAAPIMLDGIRMRIYKKKIVISVRFKSVLAGLCQTLLTK